MGHTALSLSLSRGHATDPLTEYKENIHLLKIENGKIKIQHPGIKKFPKRKVSQHCLNFGICYNLKS